MIPPLVAVVHWMESNRGPCRREGRPTAQVRPLEPLSQPAAPGAKGQCGSIDAPADREDD